MHPEVAVGAVVVHNGALLLIRRRNPPEAGRWSVPGGRVRFGEPIWEAVVREVREETGIEVTAERLLGWVERIGDRELESGSPGHHFVILDFAATPLEADPAPCPGDDASDAAWVPLADLAEVDLVDGLADFLVDVGVLDPARLFEL